MTIENEVRYERIAIIGGGPAGLAAAKALALEPKEFKAIDLYERRDQLGGLWYHKGDKSLIHPQVPWTDPNLTEFVSDSASRTDEYTSAIYQIMETNIVYDIMEYRDVHFNKDSKIYPSRQSVLHYIERYIDSIPQGKVTFKLNTNVETIEKIDNCWYVNTETDNIKYDAVIIANGHFNVPFIPKVTGLAQWNKNLPTTISHSKYYQSSNDYKGKNVLIIGNSASGLDISTQIATVANKVFVSVKDKSSISFKNPLCEYIGMIEQYNHQDKSVKTVENEIISNIDYVIFCTGYFYNFPFLNVPITDGVQVKDLYKQIFYINDPSLSFVALLKMFLPMPVSEYQSALIARVYSGRYELPTFQQMQNQYQVELLKKGHGAKFHDFSYPKDIEYCQHLKSLIEEQNCLTPGLIGPEWTKKKIIQRSESKTQKDQRIKQVIDWVVKLREQGEEFSLPP